MNILAIETSADDTGVALLSCDGPLDTPIYEVVGAAVASQIEMHQEYGGIYPSVAKREHSRNLVPTLLSVWIQAFGNPKSKTLISKKTQNPKLKKILEREPELYAMLLEHVVPLDKPDVDAIAVTVGPGLEPALWVGLNFAKALSLLWDVPLVPVNHMEGHMTAVLKESGQIAFPAIALLISGGHTELVLVHAWGEYELIGRTRDDAVGEAFDKTARLLGLPYPGGPEISKLATRERKENLDAEPVWNLPTPMLQSSDFDFSFSGLKTSVLYKVRDKKLSEADKQTLAREFEDTIVHILTRKTRKALEQYDAHTLIIGGGVIANSALRNAFQEMIQTEFPDITLRVPDLSLTGDNAVMIGIAGYLKLLREGGMENKLATERLRADGNLRLAS